MKGFSTQFLVIGDTILEEKQARTDVLQFFRSFIPIFGQNIICGALMRSLNSCIQFPPERKVKCYFKREKTK